MAASSYDESFVERVARALGEVRLDAVIIGNIAAILQGAPVTTQDIDLLIRRTPRNQQKIQALRAILGGLGQVQVVSDVDSLVGAAGTIDLVYDVMPPRLRFESVRSRATRMDLGGTRVAVASLADVIRSKRAADRPKDRAVLPILEQTADVQRTLAKTRPRPRRT